MHETLKRGKIHGIILKCNQQIAYRSSDNNMVCNHNMQLSSYFYPKAGHAVPNKPSPGYNNQLFTLKSPKAVKTQRILHLIISPNQVHLSVR